MNYYEYLNRISSPKTFKRKCAWLGHNFGEFFHGEQRVLEIGPGLGEFLGFITSCGSPVIDVVDRDEGVLEIIRSRFPIQRAWKCSAENLNEIAGDLGIYDRIFVLQVMEHIETKHLCNFIRVLYEHLAPGGMAIITVPNGANPLSIVERYSDITHHNLFSENSLKQLVEMSNLKDAVYSVRGYRIPPVSAVDICRKVAQKLLHYALKMLLIINGGVFFSVYDPNITLIIERPKK
jgi:2-polyprenyl-3-methyl-5-hydroxy-6-metoxy-1,4-benzoquinol methylase